MSEDQDSYLFYEEMREAQAEIERLKAALQEIRFHTDASACREIARAALEGK